MLRLIIELGCHRKTVEKYLNRYLETGEAYTKPKTGRRLKLSQEQAQQLKDVALRNNFLSNNQLASMFADLPPMCSDTVSNYLRKYGVRSRIAAQKPLLTEREKAIRLEISRRNLRRPLSDWSKTIYIDEFHIETGAKAKVRVKRLRGSRFRPENLDRYKVKQRRAFTAVCCFSSQGLGPITMVSGGFDAAQYLEYLIEKVIPYAEQCFPATNDGPSYFVLHDNAPIHCAAIVTSYLAETLPGRLIEHAPYSPDCNPIENLGAIFKRTFKKYLKSWPSDSEFSLKNCCQVAWREVSDNIAYVASLIDSMPSRYQAVIDANGDHTKY